jgi:hypothetical protein
MGIGTRNASLNFPEAVSQAMWHEISLNLALALDYLSQAPTRQRGHVKWVSNFLYPIWLVSLFSSGLYDICASACASAGNAALYLETLDRLRACIDTITVQNVHAHLALSCLVKLVKGKRDWRWSPPCLTTSSSGWIALYTSAVLRCSTPSSSPEPWGPSLNILGPSAKH